LLLAGLLQSFIPHPDINLLPVRLETAISSTKDTLSSSHLAMAVSSKQSDWFRKISGLVGGEESVRRLAFFVDGDVGDLGLFPPITNHFSLRSPLTA
jgi:hypothetical protein